MDLLVDDVRDLNCSCIARTFQAAFFLLNNCQFDEMYLDFDLGGQETGLDVLKHCYYLPTKIQIVTMNPVGRQQITEWLLDNGYTKKDAINFERTNQ